VAGGCIIRSAFLEKIKDAYHKDSGLSNLLLDTFFKAKIEQAQESWRRIISTAVLNGIWVPAITTAFRVF